MDSDKLLVVCTNSTGDRKLYSILRNADGQVWDWKHDKFVDFIDDKYLDYVMPLLFKGGDLYIQPIPHRAPTTKCVLTFIQGSREPDIYDEIYHVYGAEMPKDIPEKIRPMAPFNKEARLRPRSKVRVDAYSDG